MAQPFPAHQGIPQHPGLPPGHGMAPAQHPTAAHPGAAMIPQVHSGVSAPGGPQVTQAGSMMGGMPPGPGTTGPAGPVPNAHALSHFGPAQAHLFQQPQFAQNCKSISSSPLPYSRSISHFIMAVDFSFTLHYSHCISIVQQWRGHLPSYTMRASW